MIETIPTAGPALGLLLAATSFAAAYGGRDQPLSDGRTLAAVPVWLPWAALSALAVGSTLFGILNPDVFAAVMQEGITIR